MIVKLFRRPWMIVKLCRRPRMNVQLCRGPLDDGYIVLEAINDC